MTMHVSWIYPSKRADVAQTPIDPGTSLVASVYDALSATANVPIGTQTGLPGGQGWVDVAVAPGSAHSIYVVVADGTLLSAPSATVTATAPSAPPQPVSNLAVTFV
jgi:hypothetical protein